MTILHDETYDRIKEKFLIDYSENLFLSQHYVVTGLLATYHGSNETVIDPTVVDSIHELNDDIEKRRSNLYIRPAAERCREFLSTGIVNSTYAKSRTDNVAYYYVFFGDYIRKGIVADKPGFRTEPTYLETKDGRLKGIAVPNMFINAKGLQWTTGLVSFLLWLYRDTTYDKRYNSYKDLIVFMLDRFNNVYDSERKHFTHFLDLVEAYPLRNEFYGLLYTFAQLYDGFGYDTHMNESEAYVNGFVSLVMSNYWKTPILNSFKRFLAKNTNVTNEDLKKIQLNVVTRTYLGDIS